MVRSKLPEMERSASRIFSRKLIADLTDLTDFVDTEPMLLAL
jgi:hypothetical protein